MVQFSCFSAKYVAFVLAFILLVRVVPVFAVYAATGSAVMYPFDLDPLLYLGGARSMIETGANEFPFFAPLNFSFIAGLLYIADGNELVPVLSTAIMGWLTVVVLYHLARELFDERVAIVSAVLLGVYPNLVFYGINLFPETLAVFFVTGSFFWLIRYFKSKRLAYVVCAGIMWGLAAQTRGGLHFFSVGICLVIMLQFRRDGWFFYAKPVCVLLASTYSIMAMVGLMAAPFYENLPVNSQSGMGSVLHGANRIINCNPDYGMVRESLLYRINEAGEAWPEGSQVYSDALLDESTFTIMKTFFAFIAHSPLQYLKSGLERLSFLCSPNQLIIKYIKLRAYYHAPLIADLCCLALSLLFVVLFCAGCLGFCHSRDPLRLLLFLFFIFYCVLIFFTVGNVKLRLPLMPFIILYAGYFISVLHGRTLTLRKRSAVCAGFVCCLIVANSVYRYKDMAISPGEFNVRQVETSLELGFPKTALFLLEKNMFFQHYTEQQFVRLNTVRQKLNEREYQ
jgi:4-amino-4-deoxy-L-arabinose transferase-like glycosyltransferase